MESSRTSGRIDVIEGDSGRKIRCNIGDMKIPDGSTARIYARKPSGLEIYNDCTIEDGCVIVELTTQMTAEQGSTRCQVEITNSGENVTSFEFELRVHAKLKSSGSVESTNEFTALENALANAQNFATDQTLTMAGQAADAKVVGEKFSQLSEDKASINQLSLGIYTDGLMYIFVNGEPIGLGIEVGSSDPVMPESLDKISVVDGVMTILSLTNKPTQSGSVLTIS